MLKAISVDPENTFLSSKLPKVTVCVMSASVWDTVRLPVDGGWELGVLEAGFSLNTENVWLGISGKALSITLIVTGKLTGWFVEVPDSPSAKCLSDAVKSNLYSEAEFSTLHVGINCFKTIFKVVPLPVVKELLPNSISIWSFPKLGTKTKPDPEYAWTPLPIVTGKQL